MVYRQPKFLSGLSLVAAVVLLLSALAPISDSLEGILSNVGLVLLLAYLFLSWRDKRQARRDSGQSGVAAVSSSEQ
jgi:threonine/homoserine/homoserine lactone efflux protein